MGLIEIGQDALGAWAWMLFDRGGRMIDSGHRLESAEEAELEARAAFQEAKQRGEPGMPARPSIKRP